MLREEIEGMGLTVLDLRYVGASEMIFKATKPAAAGVATPSLRVAGS